MRILVIGIALAACGGGDGAVVEATFAPGLDADGVWVVQSERRERADSSGFRITGLTPGPMGIRLLSGVDTAALLNVSGLSDGARLRLLGLRVDGDSRFAFPRSVELDGARMVTVNGVRMAPEARLPRAVDARGAVLAWSSDVGALLVRPEDVRMPDLRVVVDAATEMVGTEGGRADPMTVEPGDSVRVEGRRDGGYVRAWRLTFPTPDGPAQDPRGAADGGGEGDADTGRAAASSGGAVPIPAAAAPARRAAAPVARVPATRGAERPGRGNARGRGEEKGKGKGRS